MGTYDEMDASEIERSQWCAPCSRKGRYIRCDGSYKDVSWLTEFPLAGTLEDLTEAQSAIAALDAVGTCQEAPNGLR